MYSSTCNNFRQKKIPFILPQYLISHSLSEQSSAIIFPIMYYT